MTSTDTGVAADSAVRLLTNQRQVPVTLAVVKGSYWILQFEWSSQQEPTPIDNTIPQGRLKEENL